MLNKRRKSLAIERTQLVCHISRVADACRELLTYLDLQMPVLQLLENVSHGPAEGTRAMDEAMLGSPITLHAGSFGWVKRTRCFWGSDGQTAMSAVDLQPPKHAKLEWQNGIWHGVWCGKKPFPESVVFQDRFVHAFEHKENLGNMQPQKVFATFTRALDQSEVLDVKASADACQRYLEDGRTFPAFAYESHSLVWKQSKWRQLSASERAELMAVPASVLSWVNPARKLMPQKRVRVKASLIGNSFHVPSVMLALVLLFQLIPGTSGIPLPRYAAFERCLRGQACMLESCPFLMEPENLLQQVEAQFAPLQVTLPPLCIQPSICKAVVRLQVYQGDCFWRDRPGDMGAPKWAQQRNAAKAASALGAQRGGPTSQFALHPLVPPNVGKAMHMAYGFKCMFFLLLMIRALS